MPLNYAELAEQFRKEHPIGMDREAGAAMFATWLDVRQSKLAADRPRWGHAQPHDLRLLADKNAHRTPSGSELREIVVALRSAAEEIAFDRAYIDGLHWARDHG